VVSLPCGSVLCSLCFCCDSESNARADNESGKIFLADLVSAFLGLRLLSDCLFYSCQAKVSEGRKMKLVSAPRVGIICPNGAILYVIESNNSCRSITAMLDAMSLIA